MAETPGALISGRLAADGAAAIKIDPGTADTDPKFYVQTVNPTTSGDTVEDSSITTPSGKYIQGIRYQVLDAEVGDTMDVTFCSDGTDTGTYGPENTELQSFGPIYAPVGAASTWVCNQVMFNTSKLVPAGVKPRFKYNSQGAVGTKKVLLEWLVHQE